MRLVQQLRRQLSGYRVWISLLLLYILVLHSGSITERNQMWGRWQKGWGESYGQRLEESLRELETVKAAHLKLLNEQPRVIPFPRLDRSARTSLD